MCRDVTGAAQPGTGTVTFAQAGTAALAASPPRNLAIAACATPATRWVQPSVPAASLAVTTTAPNWSVPMCRVVVEGMSACTQAEMVPLLTGPAAPLPRIEAARGAAALLSPSMKLSDNISPAGIQVLRFLDWLAAIRPASGRGFRRCAARLSTGG